jgi:hypothetical protein
MDVPTAIPSLWTFVSGQVMKDFYELQFDLSLVATSHLRCTLRRIVAKVNMMATLRRLVDNLDAMSVRVPISSNSGCTGSCRSDVSLIGALPGGGLSVAGLNLPLASHAVNAIRAARDVPMPNYRLALIARELEKSLRKKFTARKHGRLEDVSAQ